MRIFVLLAIATALLVPVALAQKPPAPPTPPPTAPPPSSTPNGPATLSPMNSQPIQPNDDLVMFLMGRVATTDGTSLPTDVVVERVCNATVRQQVHTTSHGDFNMQLGSKADTFVDASGSGPSSYGLASKDSELGIPRRDLANCELRASLSGFHSSVISLVNLNAFLNGDLGVIDVGSIAVQRREKIQGRTLSATPYKAPKDALRAYEKGLEAEKNSKLADAQKYFEKAVQIYPRYVSAWFQLGTVLIKESQKDSARTAFTKATNIDNRFLPPYLALAEMAFEARNWAEVLNFTGHILELDPLNHVSGYILDLDPLNYTDAYFYNSIANYKLNKLDEAEKSGLKAEHLDLHTRFPQVHLLLAEIFSRKNNYASAISELHTYLELLPHAQDADQVRAQLAKLEKLNDSPATNKNPIQN